MENTANKTLEDAIKQVFKDMGSLTREDLLEIIKSQYATEECEIDMYSSRVCSRGTKSCILLHLEDETDII